MHIKPITYNMNKLICVALMCLCVPEMCIHKKIYESKFYFYCRIAEWYSFLVPLVVIVICCFHFNSYDGKVVYYSIQWKFHRCHCMPFLPAPQNMKNTTINVAYAMLVFLLLWPKENDSNGRRQKSEREKSLVTVKFGYEKNSEMSKPCISCRIHTRMRFFFQSMQYKCTHMQWPITHMHGWARDRLNEMHYKKFPSSYNISKQTNNSK